MIGYFFGDKLGVIDQKLGPWGFTLVFVIGPILMAVLAVIYHLLFKQSKEGDS